MTDFERKVTIEDKPDEPAEKPFDEPTSEPDVKVEITDKPKEDEDA